MKKPALILLASLPFLRAEAQSVLFDFENAAQHTPLPITLTVGGITAHFSGGYSIQAAGSVGVVLGAELVLAPAADGMRGAARSRGKDGTSPVDFVEPLTDFSILYAPQELACDSSATMRVTAYFNGAWIGTATTNAQAGTWPSETLQIHSIQPFNRAVVHYDKAPVTGGDYGVMFTADNMAVTAAPPILLGHATNLANRAFQFAFTNTPGATFTVLASTNLTTPLTNWQALGSAAEISSGFYQFTDSQATNRTRCFYRVSSP